MYFLSLWFVLLYLSLWLVSFVSCLTHVSGEVYNELSCVSVHLSFISKVISLFWMRRRLFFLR